ncbi:hypothetical protein DFJ74DRAFT_688552 [Hyaloraphidium curvatum]|nr:hypothetical protein DFJ74DRAFT_688552 [Hyaloraphidium curvatum]
MAPQGKVKSKTVVMARYPEGAPVPEDFGLVEELFDLDVELKEGELLLKNVYVTCDPYMRMRMAPGGPSYSGGSFQIGHPIQGYGVSYVLRSANPKYAAGIFISTVLTKWAEYQVLSAAEVASQEASKMLVAVDPEEEKRDGIPLPYYVGPLGTSGITAWVGLNLKGKPAAGETVLVSAAAGAVGQSVCIFAKAHGCRVVGSAGGADKCKSLLEDLGIDAAVDYKHPEGGSLAEALKKACPKGVDVYFDNVGGDLLMAAFHAANPGARFPICGQISRYNTSPGLAIGAGLPEEAQKLIDEKKIDYAPFNVRDYRAQYFEEAVKDIKDGIRRGDWKKYRLDIRPGLKGAGAFYCEMLKGGNRGKSIVEISPPRA